MDPVLKSCLQPLLRRLRWCGFWREASVLCGLGLVIAGVAAFVAWVVGWGAGGGGVAFVLVVTVAVGFWRLRRRRGLDLRQVALDLEAADPELRGRLLTAVQQQPVEGQRWSYLQDRLVTDLLRSGHVERWSRLVGVWSLVAWPALSLAALVFFGGAVWGLAVMRVERLSVAAVELVDGVRVTPGDTELERGESLVVLAEFGREVPVSSELVVLPKDGVEQRVSMTRNLSERIFGATYAGLRGDVKYHVEFPGGRSPDYAVEVYELPRMEKSDVDLAYPEYTGMQPRRVEDTRRVTAVEGAGLTLSLTLNKPVKEALLVGDEGEALDLLVDLERPVAWLTNHVLLSGGGYELRLVDGQGRTNRAPARFVFEVLTNRFPDLRITKPRGDLNPSPLEEVWFEAEVADDFGVVAYGIGWEREGEGEQWVELGRDVPAGERRQFTYRLALEDVGVVPDDLVVWYAWGDDLGADGRARRHTTDLFFGEVRPFEEIFREGEAAAGQGGGESPEGGGGGEQGGSQQLVQLQKEIINATWNLRRRPGGDPEEYRASANIILDAQSEVRVQAEEAGAEGMDMQSSVLWSQVLEAMDASIEALEGAVDSRDGLEVALGAEQSAYRRLLQLREREMQVARGQRGSSSRGGSQGQQARQRQLDQLELTRSDNAYETETQAQEAGRVGAQSEELQALSRLKELARRQEDLNQRLQDLQTELAMAEGEEEQERLRRELKRLQEEEQRMLSDLDELGQRMERQQGESSLAEQREQLERTREALQRAEGAAERGEVSEALAAGTRAQRQMESMRDALRQESAGEFGEDLRRMRGEARELTRRQGEIQRAVDELVEPTRRVLSDRGERERLSAALDEQRDAVQRLVESSKRVSEAAELAEPLVYRELYEALREFSVAEESHVDSLREELIDRGLMTEGLMRDMERVEELDGGQTLSLVEEMLDAGYLPLADQLEDLAREGVGVLVRGVEQAAERVLGDESESLRRARDQVDEALASLQEESERGGERLAEERAGEDGSSERQPAEGGGERGDGGEGESGGFDLGSLLAGEENESDGRRGGVGGSGPIRGDGFEAWSDRLREAEELLELPQLRDLVRSARERGREMRRDFKTGEMPDWAVVSLDVIGPLVEVRRQIAEELARRTPGEELVPLDRDPVPAEYSELVRRYYEDLGRGRAE